MAADAVDSDIRRMLLDCGEEEFLHAERLAQVLTLLTDGPHSVPNSEENPSLVGWEKQNLSIQLVDMLAAAEACGEALYTGGRTRARIRRRRGSIA